MSIRRTAVVGLALFALAGCGSSATPAPPTAASGAVSATAPASAPASDKPSTDPAPAPTATTTASGASVTLDEHANRTVVKVAAGTTVQVVLHSSYWSGVTSSAPKVVQAVTAASGSAPATCRPGAGGCGTVGQTFVAAGPGTAELTASRTSCGEAMACAPDQRTFSMTIQVGS